MESTPKKSAVNRFFSRRDKPKSKIFLPLAQHLRGLFSDLSADETLKISEKDLEKKIKETKARLSHVDLGLRQYTDSDISFVLHSQYGNADPEKAADLLTLLNESESGLIREFHSNISLLGAVNRGSVSCYLDSVLFAMFGRLDSFEAMLYNQFEDSQKQRLATLLRLWVNMVRAGRLVTTDITRQLQETLGICGWKEAAELQQQDASEAFSFITEQLELPMLTLKMDIYHNGKEEADDDHKLVEERILEVAIPEEPPGGGAMPLEDCLETYFNNRIEVKRYLERMSTMSSMRPRALSLDSGKPQAHHIETVEADNTRPSTPPSATHPGRLPPYSPRRQFSLTNRAPSIVQETYVYEKSEKFLEAGFKEEDIPEGSKGRGRAVSLRKEVMMPAWQFFSLIPWYTNVKPCSDAQIAAYFSSKRPVLGICLKRYSYLPNGNAVRRETRIDCPIEIGLPHFIHDDKMDDSAAAFGNFKLSLQSVVCHRGKSVNSGHYISVVRKHPHRENGEWLLFDDLAKKERIRDVEIEQLLKTESPYLLFYQVQPIDGDPGNVCQDEKRPNGRPPSYHSSSSARDSGIAGLHLRNQRRRSSGNEPSSGTERISSDDSELAQRGRSIDSENGPQHIVFVDGANDRKGETRISHEERKPRSEHIEYAGDTVQPLTSSGSKEAKSRPVSQSGDSRLSSSFTRFTGFTGKLPSRSKPDLGADGNKPEDSQEQDSKALLSMPEVVEAASGSAGARKESRSKSKGKSRLSQSVDQHFRSRNGEKPDRECLVM